MSLFRYTVSGSKRVAIGHVVLHTYTSILYMLSVRTNCWGSTAALRISELLHCRKRVASRKILLMCRNLHVKRGLQYLNPYYAGITVYCSDYKINKGTYLTFQLINY